MHVLSDVRLYFIYCQSNLHIGAADFSNLIIGQKVLVDFLTIGLTVVQMTG